MNLSINSISSTMSSRSRIIFSLLLTTIIFAFSSCIASRMVPFDLTSLNQAKALKTSAIDLMVKATGSYADNTAAIDAFSAKATEHIAYEEARGEKNQTSINMWKLLMNPDNNLMGGFLKRWKAEGTLGTPFINQIKKEVGDNFQSIIDLENKKKRK